MWQISEYDHQLPVAVKRKIIRAVEKYFQKSCWHFDFDKKLFVYKKGRKKAAEYNPDDFEIVLYMAEDEANIFLQYRDFSSMVIQKYVGIKVDLISNTAQDSLFTTFLVTMALWFGGIFWYWQFSRQMKKSLDENKKAKQSNIPF